MATLKCPISGIRYHCPHIPVATSYPHPIFSLEPKDLDKLFCRYMREQLSPTESYLLLIAYLKATDAVIFRHPVTLNPNSKLTAKLVATNLAQLLTVVEKTKAILHPSFSQPQYAVTTSNSNLSNLQAYIEVWQRNIVSFHDNYREEKLDAKLKAVENKLTYLINSGEERLTAISLAEWADLCADFPAEKREHYKRIIRSCYNQEKMFSLKLTELTELKEELLANIVPGSIYMHKLLAILDHGIELNKGFLGYEILEDPTDKVAILAAQAPLDEPSRLDYPSQTEYLKARLKWSISQSRNKGGNI